MRAERRTRVDEIVLRILQTPDADRPSVLRRECGDDPALQAELEAPYRAARRGEEIMPQPVTVTDGTAADLESTPERIGPYRILRVIGRGGMGVVYLARQDEPLPRTVAIKRVLADLSHP